MIKNVYYAEIHLLDGQHKYVFTDHRKLFDFLRQSEPLCYVLSKITINNEHELFITDTQDKVKLYPRSTDCAVSLLNKLQQFTTDTFYSDLPSAEKYNIDILLRVKLVGLKDDKVILYNKNIKLWNDVYKRSFNWYKYYIQDKENDKFGRLRCYYGERE